MTSPALLEQRSLDLALVYRAQRALMRQQLVDAWGVLPRLASAHLDAWVVEASQRGLGAADPAYWRAAEAWLLERVGRP